MFKKANDSKASENQKKDASATAIIPIAGQPQPLTGESSPIILEAKTQGGPVSCIGSGMSIIGNIECIGPVEIFGFIQGEIRATDLVIGKGAQITGNVVAWEVTINGHVRGTIRRDRVKLQNGGVVEGEVFHRSLSIDESSFFEGRSRRIENSAYESSWVDAKGTVERALASAPACQSSAISDVRVGRENRRPRQTSSRAAAGVPLPLRHCPSISHFCFAVANERLSPLFTQANLE